MLDQYELIAAGTVAALVLTASLMAMAANRRRISSEPTAILRQAVAEASKARKLRKIDPAQIAQRVVAEIRSTSLNEYPILPEDLNTIIDRWCTRHDVEMPCHGVVREIVATLPGVKRNRPWLNLRKQTHQYVRQRQAVHKIENDRPTLYWIDDLPDIPAEIRPVERERTGRQAGSKTLSSARPSSAQSVQTRAWTGDRRDNGPTRRVA